MKDGVACLDSWYDTYSDAFEILKAKSSNNEYMVNICYSYDMKENEHDFEVFVDLPGFKKENIK